MRDGSGLVLGGVTSGIDLALALVEDDFGSEVALQTARVMVVFVKRPGGQSQYSVPLAAQVSDRGAFAGLHTWMREHLADDLRVDELADVAGMSRRTFMRSYAAATGRTPGKALEAMRLEAARVALEETTKSLKLIARETGFGDEGRMRRVFQTAGRGQPGRLSRALLAAHLWTAQAAADAANERSPCTETPPCAADCAAIRIAGRAVAPVAVAAVSADAANV